MLITDSEEEVLDKYKQVKDGMEAKALMVSAGITKIMISGVMRNVLFIGKW